MYATPDDGIKDKPESAHRPPSHSHAATLSNAESILDMVQKSTPRIDDDLMLLNDESEASSGTEPPSTVAPFLSPPHPYHAADNALDASLDDHFDFIQEVSASQELDQLLPNVTKALLDLTDVRTCLLKQGFANGTLTAAEQLSTLARLCFTRALGACWLLPSMDLLVRCKLNIIGRHLFLEEKLSKLSAASSLVLPPRLTPESIEAFLDCSWLSGKGCLGILSCISKGIRSALGSPEITPPLDAEVTSRDLVQIMASMLRETEAALTDGPMNNEEEEPNGFDPSSPLGSPRGPCRAIPGVKGSQGPAWAFILAGPPARTLKVPRAADKDKDKEDVASSPSEPLSPESRRMAEDLRAELISVLSSHRFSDALRSSVQHAFRQLARHIYDALPPPPLNCPSPCSSPSGMQRSLSHLFGSVPSGGQGGRAGEVVGGETRPFARMLKPMQAAADLLLVPGNVKGLTKGISELSGVMALTAEVFSGPSLSSGGLY